MTKLICPCCERSFQADRPLGQYCGKLFFCENCGAMLLLHTDYGSLQVALYKSNSFENIGEIAAQP